MPPTRVDLHLHSSRSDGEFSPEEVLEKALASQLDCLALTDHDLPNAIPAGVYTGKRPLRVIAATELSGNHMGRELHLLVYFPGEMPEGFAAFLREQASARAVRYDTAVARLGGDLPAAPPEAHAGQLALTRKHLFFALRRAKRAASPAEGYRQLGPSVVPPIALPFTEAIRRARAAGGLTSWAHPSLEDAQAFTHAFVEAGLQGLEAVRPGLPRPTFNGLKRLAKRFNLLVTGGSDWHGWSTAPLGLFALDAEYAAPFLQKLDA